MRNRLSTHLLMFCLLISGPAQAQWTSQWSQINLQASFLGPDSLDTPNAVLISDHLWQAYAETTNLVGATFSFEDLQTGQGWGDANQTGTSIPMAGTAEADAGDMTISGLLPAVTRYRFNEQTLAYSVEDATPGPDPTVWINEVDYNNPGTDTNEWIELAGFAGVALDDFEIVLINQTGATYRTVDLAPAGHVFADESGGFGFFVVGIVPDSLSSPADYTPGNWTSNMIQNGSPDPDSILLRRKDGTPVHLVDYPGVNPNTSQDQVAGADSGSEDSSIYLSGFGGGNFDGFAWQNTAGNATPRAANPGQTLEPQPAPYASVVLTGPTLEPPSPSVTEEVHVLVDAMPENGASNLALTTFYRADPGTAFSPIPMQPESGDTFRTVTPIPAQAEGASVEYYIFVTFDGGGTNSPSFLGSPTEPLAYGSRFPTGAVWINEMNAEAISGIDTNEFVEIAGPAHGDISDWTVELYSSTTNAYASYTFPEGARLSSDGSGYGFFVLGDTDVPGVDLVFNHPGSGQSHLANSGVLRLLNELGAEQLLLSYGEFPPADPFPTAEWIGFEDFFAADDEHLALEGTGSRYGHFTWGVQPGGSPGTANGEQTLTGGNPSDPEVDIVSIKVSAETIVIRSTGNNTWAVVPEQTTDLNAGEPGWIPIAPSTTTFAGGTNTTEFATPDDPHAQFRIQQTPR